MTPTSSTGDVTFGYFPDDERIDVALDRGRFARALVLDTPVRSLADQVSECRVLWHTDVELPEGVYWFQGVDDGPIILQVAGGALPGGAMVESPYGLDAEHPLLAAWGWAEELWHKAAMVPAPLFAVNEAVLTHPGGVDVVVRDRKFLREHWTYTVMVEGRQQDVVESRLRPRPQIDAPPMWVTREPTPASRFGATLTRAKLLGKFANTLFSFRATRTTFRPYQFKPVLKLLQTGKARLLIADEVGLGKTIEAGLIWTEMEARGEADRVLVVCPSGLVGKWKEEMEDRFEFELTELDSAGLKSFLERHQQNRLPARQAYICSLERLRTWGGLEDLQVVPPEFDLVIVDEAHSMRNQDTKNYALGTELADWAANLVFLTATPINLREQDLLNLLELLVPEDYGSTLDLQLRLEPNRIINAVTARLGEKGVRGRDLIAQLDELRTTSLGGALMRRPDFGLLRDVLAKDQMTPRGIVDAKRYLAGLNTLSTVITRTKKVEVDDHKAKRTENRQEIEWTNAEFDFYKEYVQWCVNRAAAMDSNLYFAMQMPLRLASACLPMARQAVLDPDTFGDITDADSDAAAYRLEPHAELVAAAQRLPEHVDTKFDALQEVLRGLHQQERRALLFTHSRPTLAYLAGRLGTEFKVAVMHGGVSREARRQIMGDFRARAYDFVLANRVASEGLDFEFCSAVINYDLPWNPMEIEQRIGRIDRIGQKEETILVVNFVNEETIDERILARLLDRIEIFESSIGALEPIISAQAPKALQAGFDFTLTEEQRDQKLHEALTAIEEQRAGLRDVSDASSALLVSNDVDVAGLEDDLVRTGRYIGQRELALLLDDWARTDAATGVRFAPDGLTLELRGNATMAARVDDLAKSAQRSRTETRSISAQLRNELPVTLVLDQEHARTHGGTLLTATSPLTMAAAAIPGHRQARFASLRITADSDEVAPGTYVVVLATAATASRRGDEIWGAAVTQAGRNAGDGSVDALLAALAEGKFVDAPLPTIDRLPTLAERAMNRLHLRHLDEQDRRDGEFDALKEARIVTVTAQHERKLATIRKRIETALARGRGQRVLAGFRGQERRAEEKFAALLEDIRTASQPEIRLEPLAACVVQIVDRMETG
ncbi:helicase-related protein [Micromonospora cremea]|uniref:Helicase conserved C-terminal domain-containing protein n=1 Tax=Micromonospora cremea TaxID=709881 RepID=A0A1N6AP02_9ACTN|nr:helicase-related protein [Micromonospora cremea]SIN35714.1 Helicase conserved C-terminal domain-containing protein [Micromonospora cremea]